MLTLAMMVTLLTSCGTTPPSKYYLLAADATAMPGPGRISLGVGPVTIPDYLKARGMVLGRDDHLLQVSEYERWAEPLDAGISRVLLLNLASLVDTRKVYPFPWRTDTVPDYAVQVGVIQFAAGTDQALLEATWTVTKPATGERVRQYLSRHSLPLGSRQAEAVADVYSALLLQLSEEIADVITSDLAASEG